MVLNLLLFEQVLKSCINNQFIDSDYNANESLCVALTTSELIFNSDKCDELHSEGNNTESSANTTTKMPRHFANKKTGDKILALLACFLKNKQL